MVVLLRRVALEQYSFVIIPVLHVGPRRAQLDLVACMTFRAVQGQADGVDTVESFRRCCNVHIVSVSIVRRPAYMATGVVFRIRSKSNL
jgi:hypothetical protein